MSTQLVNAIISKDIKALTEHVSRHFRYQSRKHRFVASNNYLDLDNMTAWSYGWWMYFRRIGGLWVFNSHRYSPSTGRHQQRMRSLLSRLGIQIDIEVDTRSSLTNMGLNDVKLALITQRAKLQEQLAALVRPKSAKRDHLELMLDEVESNLNSVIGQIAYITRREVA